MKNHVQAILSRVLERVTPSEKEIKAEKAKAEELLARIMAVKAGQVEAVFVGSASRNTHLKGDKDLDLFVLFPESMPENVLERHGLEIGKAVAKGHEFRVMHASHPYVQAVIDGFDVEIVPAFKVSRPSRIKSAVDRTPFHAEYVRQNLQAWQCDEVRLLKAFLKGLGVYGAEISVKGFSGYLCELLVIKYGTFLKVLEGASKWSFGEVVDLNSHTGKKFEEPLIVVDPVDPERNVAAPVSKATMAKFIHYSRAFLKNPSMEFFERRHPKSVPIARVERELDERKSFFAALKMPFPHEIEDVAFSQLETAKDKIVTLLTLNEFKVHRSDILWTKETAYLLFELEAWQLPKYALRPGPLVSDVSNTEAFVQKCRELKRKTWIEHGRWVAEVPRKETLAAKLLERLLKEVKAGEARLPSHVANALKKGGALLVQEDLLKEFKESEHFAHGFSEYLFRQERFLEETEA